MVRVMGSLGTGAEGAEEEEEAMLEFEEEGPPLEGEEKGLLGPEKAFLKWLSMMGKRWRGEIRRFGGVVGVGSWKGGGEGRNVSKLKS